MKRNLVIIESPNKIKTISKYLGNDFEIIATVGHIRDIPKSNRLAFDQKTYEPNWKVITKPSSKQPIIDEIKLKAKVADKIYLASDPDREGEAIAWHVYDVLDKQAKSKTVRITFNEITKDAILNALKKERQIEMDWVHSQFARRILDRIIGYDLSAFVRKKFHGSSAGRVQSVVLKFIYDREQEIKKFKPKTWFTLDTVLKNGNKLILRSIKKVSSDVKVVDDEQLGSGVDFNSEKSIETVKKELSDKFKVYLIDPPKTFRKNSKDPYKTSTLQQDAVTRLGWSLSKTTKVIQELYEGIDIDKEHIALISYPRTDSIRMSDDFIAKAKTFIKKVYGEEYVLQTARSLSKQKKDNNVQDAHECIRVIDPYMTPLSLKSKISTDHYKMYELIWRRTISSLMSPSVYGLTVTRFINNGYKFYTHNRALIFNGFEKVWLKTKDEQESDGCTSKYQLNKTYEAKSIQTTKHVSTPPDRYSQASLIATLDESGVGRPSTYRTMADIGLQRGYCELKNRSYLITDVGVMVIEGLLKNFGDIVGKDFTKDMELRLDAIADHKENWNKWIKEFVPKLEKKVAKLSDTIKVKELYVPDRTCPKCSSKLVYRFSKKTKKRFIGCSNFPTCDYVEFETPKTEPLNLKCPKCGRDLVEKFNRKGQKFVGCSNYPNCDFIAKNKKDAELIISGKKTIVKKAKKDDSTN